MSDVIDLNEKQSTEAMHELGEALRANGLSLPSLRVCPMVLTGSPPLVDLGSANLKTVRHLAELLRKVADAPES